MREFILTLLSCSVTVAAVGLIIMLLTPLLTKRYSAKIRYYLWLIILFDLLIPFIPNFEYAVLEINVPAGAAAFFGTLDDAPAEEGELAEPPILSAASTRPDTASALSPLIWALQRQKAVALWAAGIALFLCCHAIKHIRFAHMTRRWREPVKDGDAFRLLEILREEMGVAGRVRLFLCPCVSTPMATGLFRHSILLPSAEYDPDELRYILLHELTHIRRRDLWYRAFALLVTALHWFNPVVYLIGSRINLLSEISCDSELVRGADGEARMRYTETIIGVVKRRSSTRSALSTGFYSSMSSMKARISSIMDTGKKSSGLLLFCGALAITFATGSAFTVVAPVTPPQLASVTLTADTAARLLSRHEGGVNNLDATSHPLIAGEINMDEAIAIAKASVPRYIRQLVVRGGYAPVEMNTESAALLFYPPAGWEEGMRYDSEHDYWTIDFLGADPGEGYIPNYTVTVHAKTGLITAVTFTFPAIDAGAVISPERMLSAYMEDLGAGGFAPSGEYDQLAEEITETTVTKDIAGGTARAAVAVTNVALGQLSVVTEQSPQIIMLKILPPDTWPVS